MKGRKGLFKGMASLSLAMILTVSAIPMGVSAEVGPDGLCEHHTQHDLGCGYIACNMNCTDTNGDGEIDHVEGCEYEGFLNGECTYKCEICASEGNGDQNPDGNDNQGTGTTNPDGNDNQGTGTTNPDGNGNQNPNPGLVTKTNLDVIYVDGTLGNDANTGASSETPVATIAEAMKYVNNGGTVYLLGDATISSLDTFKSGVSLIGNGSNTVTFTGSVGDFSSVSEFAKVVLNGVDVSFNINNCGTLEMNNGARVRGIINVGTLNCYGSGSFIRNAGGNVATNLSVESGLDILIPGKFMMDMEGGIVVLTCSNPSSDAIGKVTLNSMNAGNGKFCIAYKDGSFVTEEHTHSMEYFSKEATCTEDGFKAYYKCSTCDKMYKDEQATIPLDSITTIPAKGHDLVDKYSFDAKEHWYACNNRCGAKDSVGEHTLDENNVCTVCGCKIYKVLEGASESYKPGVTESISFRFEGKVEYLLNVYVGGRLVPSNFYEVKSDSVIIVLSADYLKTLPVGTHTLKVDFYNGVGEAKFETLLADQGTGGTEGGNTDSGNGDNSGTEGGNTGNAGTENGGNTGVDGGNTGNAGTENGGDKVDEKDPVINNTEKEPVTDNKGETEKDPVKESEKTDETGKDKDKVTETENKQDGNKDKKSDAVATGDSTGVVLLAIIMMVSTMAMIGTSVFVSADKKHRK